MKYLSRNTLAVLLVGLFAVIVTSPAQAQGSQQHWDNAHPLEYYLALPGMPQPAQPVPVAQVQTPQKNWDNAHPLEYYLALPGIPQAAQTVQVAQVQTSHNYWDNAHPLEYYLALPGMTQPAQDAAIVTNDAICGSC